MKKIILLFMTLFLKSILEFIKNRPNKLIRQKEIDTEHLDLKKLLEK